MFRELTLKKLATSVLVFAVVVSGLLLFSRDSSAAVRIFAGRARSTASNVRTTACDFTPQHPCAGQLKTTFLGAPTVKELKDAYKNNWPSANDWGSYRQWDCGEKPSNNCPTAQYGQPDVNPDSRNFDPAAIPYDVPVIVGSIRWSIANSKNDRSYKIGANLEDERRRVYIVAYRRAGDVYAGTGYGRQVAHYTIYGLPSGKETTPDILGNGFIVRCDHDSDDKGIEAHFRGCKGQQYLDSLSRAKGVPSATLARLAFCSTTQAVLAPKDRGSSCEKLTAALGAGKKLTKQLAGLTQVDIASLVAFGADETRAAYWFSCSNGCCTADY